MDKAYFVLGMIFGLAVMFLFVKAWTSGGSIKDEPMPRPFGSGYQPDPKNCHKNPQPPPNAGSACVDAMPPLPTSGSAVMPAEVRVSINISKETAENIAFAVSAANWSRPTSNDNWTRPANASSRSTDDDL